MAMGSRLRSSLRVWLRAFLTRGRFEDAMSEEMRFHIDQYVDDLVRGGLPPDEARRRARVEFGSVERVKEECREARGLRLIDAVRRDTRQAIRLMRRSPGFSLTALATLALCLGANLTIFAVVDAIVLRPLPFPQSERLMSVYNTYPRAGVMNDGCSLTNYYERRGQLRAFAGIAAYRDQTAIVGETGATEQVPITRVSPDYFATLGIAPVLGRAFTEADTTYATSRLVILSDAYWRERLQADPAAIGRALRVNGNAMTIVGILPPEFRFLSSRARLYFPLASNADEHAPPERHSGNTDMIARLAPGVTVAEAQAELDAHNTALERTNPMGKAMADAGFRSIVVPLQADHVAGVRPMLLLVQAGALCLLLIGAVNLVNLLLIRASARAKERALRLALGASRGHIVSEVLIETTVLTLCGGLLGLLVGAFGIRIVSAAGADLLPLGARIELDARLAVAALLGAALLGIVMGLPIAWSALRQRGAHPLQAETRGGTASRAAQRLRHGFIVAQIALAFVLLSGAGLLGLSLKKAMEMPAGFRPEQVVSGRLAVSGKMFPSQASLLGFTEQLVDALEREPGVQAAGIATNVPLSGISNKSAVTVQGHVRRAGEPPRGHYSYSVNGAFFEAIGATLVEGRLLTAADSRSTTRVAVVDEDFARVYWPDGHAIGQRIFSGRDEGPAAEAYTIVGVIRPMKQAALTDDAPQGAAFFPFGHRMDGEFFVVARTSLPTAGLTRALQGVVRGLQPELPVSDVLPMETRVADSLVTRRSPALLAALFSGIALLLTAIGTYGVLSYAVARRRREIGLRMALGARPDQVRAQFLALAARLLAAGAIVGLLLAAAASRALQAVLFQVPALHAATLTGTFAVLTVVALAACLLPSRRAARISPMQAMSEE